VFVVDTFSPFGPIKEDPGTLNFRREQAEYGEEELGGMPCLALLLILLAFHAAEALQDRKLWIAKGRERQVFDETLDLEVLDGTSGICLETALASLLASSATATADDTPSFDKESVRSFAVHVPSTNVRFSCEEARFNALTHAPTVPSGVG
jgi:hypothetical protein